MAAAKRKPRSGTALNLSAVAILLVMVCSCASFDIFDWPSNFGFPHNDPPSNSCGSIGAFFAYFLLYYVGPGVFVALGFGVYAAVASLINRPLNQPVLRGAGVVLLTAAASSTFYWIWPDRFAEFPIGSGGVLGVAGVKLLSGNFAVWGGAILLAAIWLVGTVLVADTFLLAALKLAVAALDRLAALLKAAWGARDRFQRPFAAALEGLAAHRPPRRAYRAAQAPSLPPVTAAVPAARPRPPAPGPSGPLRPVAGSGGGGDYDGYVLPPLDLLTEPQYSLAAVQDKVVKAKASVLEKLLAEFTVNARVVAADTGPVVTMFELELAAGVKVSQITALSNDMARALGAGAVRVVAPLPGKHTIGIEVPNTEKEKVRLKDLIQLAADAPSRMQIPLFLGKDSSGAALVSDLAAMPHLLIAGTTGSGKSVCINSIIMSILLTKRPDEVKMILIDPKMVEMTAFNTICHLMSPIVTETNRAAAILEWAMVKMDERYSLLAEARVRNVTEYNALGEEAVLERFAPSGEEESAKIPKSLPYIVIVIDELADLMMTAAKEVEGYIVRLAQKSRAVGIHIVLATQRPQATVVTGLIKSNMPTRIGFRVAARMDSRIILDQNGAETLLGEGDMLFLKPGTSDLVRAQGAFVDEPEIKKVVRFLRQAGEPQFHPELTRLRRSELADMPRDEMFEDAVRIVLDSRRGSVSLLQRRLNVGYARASRMIEAMAAVGVLGEYKGSQAREVVMTLEQYEEAKNRLEGGSCGGEDQPAEGLSEGQSSYVAVESGG
jgi:S-DNA-T family DNA segregation ATPase FtsK/SpoIIIE